MLGDGNSVKTAWCDWALVLQGCHSSVWGAGEKSISLWERLSTVNVVLIVVTLYLLMLVIRNDKPRKNLPPGPPSLPVVGSLPFFGHLDGRKAFQKLTKKYGSIFTVDIGAERTIVLSKYDVVKEAFAKQGMIFSGRPANMMNFKFRKEFGIVTNDGEQWLTHKRRLLHMVKDLGWGRSSTGADITEAADHLVNEFKKNPVGFPKPMIQKAVTTVIINLVFGKQLPLDDPALCKTLDAVLEAGEILGLGGIMVMFPFLESVPIDLTGQKRFVALVHQICDQFKIWSEEARNSSKPNLIKAYLEEAERVKETNDQSIDMSDSQLMWTIFDLCGAGIDTTTNTLTFALLFMQRYPDIQEKVYAEINDAVGSRAPEMQDHKFTPYTDAVISEVLRLVDVTPLGVPHLTTEDTQIRGYDIPQGTTVMMNMYGIHRDPSVWTDPDTFNPDRFIDGEGNYKKRKELMSFSMGKRKCFGESLARMEMFLVLTTLLQHFKFSTPKGYSEPDLEGTLGVVYYPKPFQAFAEPRH